MGGASAPLFFFVRGAAPPPARGGPCSYSVPPRRPCRQAGPHGPPRRPGPGLSPLGVSLAAALWPSSGPKGMRRRKLPGLPGPPPAGLWPPVAGGRRGLVVWGRARRGPSPVCPGQFSPPPEARGAQPPGQAQGSPGGRAWGLCGPPAMRFGRSPRGGCVVVGGVSAAPGGAGSPWPALARPRSGGCNWLAGAPQRPGGRDGRGPLSGARAVVLFGLVPCRRRPGPRFSGRAGQRWKKAVRCPARGGLDSAACGRRGTAGGINAPGWWIANERHP